MIKINQEDIMKELKSKSKNPNIKFKVEDYKNMVFETVKRGVWFCKSNGNIYKVNTINNSCECKSFYYKGTCKHLRFFGINKDESKDAS